jgi:hypothetical protein
MKWYAFVRDDENTDNQAHVRVVSLGTDEATVIDSIKPGQGKLPIPKCPAAEHDFSSDALWVVPNDGPGSALADGTNALKGVPGGKIRVEYYAKDAGTTPTCAAMADVCRLVIAEPDEGDVFLHGDRVQFRGEGDPSGVTVADWSWEIGAGWGSPGSSSTDTFRPVVRQVSPDHDAPETFRAALTATVEGFQCMTERSIELVYPKITAIDFGGGDQYHIVDESEPEWTEGEVYSHTANRKNTRLRLRVTFGTSLPLATDTTLDEILGDVAAWVQGDLDSRAAHVVVPAGQTAGDIPQTGWIESDADIENYVLALDDRSLTRKTPDFQWSYVIEGSRYYIDPAQADNQHKLFTVVSTPCCATAEFTGNHVNKACLYADASTDGTFVRNTQLYLHTHMKYASGGDKVIWNIIDNEPGDGAGTGGDCLEHAKLMKSAIRTLSSKRLSQNLIPARRNRRRNQRSAHASCTSPR